MTTPLTGIGDAFGKAADAVIRRPTPAVVPLILDAVVFLTALVILAGLGVDVLQGPAYERVHFGFGLPAALPSLADTVNLAVVATGLGALTIAMAGAFAILLVPVTAYIEAGFVTILRAAYLDEDDEEEPLLDTFAEGARTRFAPFLLYRLVLTAAFIVTLALSAQGGAWANSAAGALALRWLLMFTPYAIGADGLGFVDGVRASVRTVSDHLATSLVILAFLLLTTGGASAILTPFVHTWGVFAVLVGIVAYAPIGTTLSVFVLMMWRHLNQVEVDAEPVAKPERVPARA